MLTIVIDVDGDGLNFVSVNFDIDADGDNDMLGGSHQMRLTTGLLFYLMWMGQVFQL